MNKPFSFPSVYVANTTYTSHYSDVATFQNHLKNLALHSFHSRELMAGLEQECLNFLNYHLSMGNISKEEFDNTEVKCSFDPITQELEINILKSEYPKN